METLLLLGLLIIAIIIGIFSLVSISKIDGKIKDDDATIERLSKLETFFIKEFGEFKDSLNTNMDKDFKDLENIVEKRLDSMNDKVNERLDANFKKTNETFTSVLQRISRIDEAQKNIDKLSTDIVSLQSILTDKKTRGIFGEINLKHIMANVFGDNNDSVYKMQYKFDTGVRVDCILFAPEPLGTICIDSKFPLENYRNMIDLNYSEVERAEFTKKFKEDVKKHIDAIASKYIIKDVTADQAIMFLPAEAIFAEINAYHSDIIEYAYSKKVYIASPTTLMATLTTIQLIIKNIERDKYTNIIHEELTKLSEEFGRYRKRWDKLGKSIESVCKEVNEINTTTKKITKRFDEINNVDANALGAHIDDDEAKKLT